MQDAAFGVARTRWGLVVERPNARCDKLHRYGDQILSGRRAVTTLDAEMDRLYAIMNEGKEPDGAGPAEG